jgi:NitT/TauT family transport system substrate-binding protein
MKKNRIGIAAISAALLFLIIGGQYTAAGLNKSSQEASVTYTIGYLPITHALPIFEEKELLEAENSGIKIELQKFSSWTDLTDALHAGKIDGASELIELAMSAKSKGVDLKAVALGHRDGNIIVTNDSIKSAADMKGKTFAIPSTQSSHYILLIEELAKAGLSLDDIEVTQLAPSEMPSSLASGAIDGYCVAEPFGAQAVTQGFGNILERSEDLWSDSVCCALVFRTDVIEKDPQAFEQLLDGYNRAGEKLEDKSEALSIAQEYLGQDEETLKTSLEWINYSDLTITKEAYDELYEKVSENNMMENVPSYEDFVYQGEE